MTLINPSIRVANGQFAPNVATTSYVVPTPAIIFPGDLLIMAACMPFNGASTPTMSAVPAGWTSLWQATVGPTADPTQGAYTTYAAYKFATASEPASYTWTSSVSNRPMCVMIAIQDTAGLDPLVSGGGFVAGGNMSATNVPGTVMTTPTITPESAGGFPLVPNGAFLVDFFYWFSAGGVILIADSPFAGYGQFTNPANTAVVTIGGLVQATQAAINGTAHASVSKGRAAAILACMATYFTSTSVTRIHT